MLAFYMVYGAGAVYICIARKIIYKWMQLKYIDIDKMDGGYRFSILLEIVRDCSYLFDEIVK